MNVNRLMGFLQGILDAETKYRVQKRLQTLDAQIQQIVNNPQTPQHQTNAKNALKELREGIDGMFGELTPAEWEFLGERDAQELFGLELVEQIESQQAANGITPAVLKSFVSEKSSKRQKILGDFRNILTNLTAVGFEVENLEPGEAEVGFIIPRQLFEDSLLGLAEEFRVIDRVLGFFSEAVTGKREPANIGELSTTDPLVLVPTAVGVAVAVGKTVTWLMDTYERTLRIRKLRAESKEFGLPYLVLKEYMDLIETTISDAIEQRIAELLPKDRKPRDGELSNGLRWSMKAILARLERGMRVEVRFLPPPVEKEAGEAADAASQAQQSEFAELAEIQQDLMFPLEVEGEPILALPPADPANVEKKSQSRPRKTKNGKMKADQAAMTAADVAEQTCGNGEAKAE